MPRNHVANMLSINGYLYPQLTITLLLALTAAWLFAPQSDNKKCAAEKTLPIRESDDMADVPNSLSQTPEEILHQTLRYLDDQDLRNFALSCRWAYKKATPLIWQHVELVDCTKTNPATSELGDEHDDTLIIRKLLVLATNPWIASHVHTLTHRCHLPPPAIFFELPRSSFQGRTLSNDERTLCLLDKACRNLSNLHTLKIIFGHWNLTRSLLVALLANPHGPSIRHMWLENCSIAGIPDRLLRALNLSRLESLRLRRLPILAYAGRYESQEVYCRGPRSELRRDGVSELRQNGKGGVIRTSTELFRRQEATLQNLVWSHQHQVADTDPLIEISLAEKQYELLFEDAHTYDKEIYKSLADEGALLSSIHQDLPKEARPVIHSVEHLVDRSHPDFMTSDTDPFPAFIHILELSSASLTSLNLDWVLFRRTDQRASLESTGCLEGLFRIMFGLFFPCLRAFQFRNAVVAESELPPFVYLLDACDADSASKKADMCIKFLERHSKLRCLAWPADRFFRETDSTTPDLRARADRVISDLAHSLEDLRVDTIYSPSGEYKTDDSIGHMDTMRRSSRRRFISEFAARMQNIQCLKLEGGIPRDEKRETIRALHQCPLQKIVMIGVNCPIGNTWGFGGRDVGSLGINEDPDDPDDFGSLEEEDTDEIVRLGIATPQPANLSNNFEAQYGWPPSGPFLHTLASCHANTITELKFCGYRGAPLLWDPTPITTHMLAPLRHFHKLRHLILSLWLHTLWEGDHRDDEILAYWLDTRDASSTALVINNNTNEPPTGWAKELAEKYEPRVMAARIVTLMGPYISERAKARPGGMHVRASFCIGSYGGLFDFDVIVGKAADGSDELKGWKGPREELHPERRAEKLRNRRWFETPVRRDLGDGQRVMSVGI